jgi:hypothetical protein
VTDLKKKHQVAKNLRHMILERLKPASGRNKNRLARKAAPNAPERRHVSAAGANQ